MSAILYVSCVHKQNIRSEMKTKQKLYKTKPKSIKMHVKKTCKKPTSVKNSRVKKSVNIVKPVCNPDLNLRRSVRISERQLDLHFSLSDDDDSGNEADDGAFEELNALSDCEDDDAYIHSDRDCLDDGQDDMSDDDVDDSSNHDKQANNGCGANTSWHQNTEHFDKLNKNFRENPLVGDIGETETDCFGKIFDLQVIELLVTETNRYAMQNRSKNWIDITAVEMKAFIGCLIVMGIHQLPALKHYWSSDPFLRVDAVASVMTANRFKKIVENMHCNDNETQPPKSSANFDKLHKVKPLVELLNIKSRSIYKPSGVVCVDESMIPFKGRYTLKQYMPNKPVKWGYKVWCLCDSYTGQLHIIIQSINRNSKTNDQNRFRRRIFHLYRQR